MAAILYRYAQFKGYGVSDSTPLFSFTDCGTTSKYAKAPKTWAVVKGHISGKDNGCLATNGSATRAQVAAILTRFNQLFS